MANTGCAGSAIVVAPICLNFGITAPVLSWVITWRGRIEIKSPLRTTLPGASPSAWRAAIFSTSVRPIPRLSTINSQLSTIGKSFLCRAFTKKLGDIEIYEICMMKDDRLDRALHLIAFMTVRGDDVHHFAGNPMLVGQRDAAERMPHLLAKFALDHFA